MSDEEEIFEQALRISEPRERETYLDRACAAQPHLRQEVQALLKAHEQTAGILESPVAQMLDAPSAEQPGTLVGNYKLLEQIGEGGMGVVYMAEQLRPVKRRVALKILKAGLDTKQVIARFEAERQALAMMDHPNIARVFDAGVTETGRPYFAMELVRGIPITQFCDQDRLTTRQRLELFVQVCQAVQHAHQKGIIHRDLKPTNVLVTLADDGKPASKIIDFGVAKATGGQRLVDQTLFTELRQLIGTPLYMSPEQAERSSVQDVDTRSDIYSLGVLLYELLTGTTPFDKNRLATAAYDEVRRIIREEEPPRPSTRLSTLGQTISSISAQRQTDPKKLSQTVRGELDWIVMKALEKDRARRYETANSLARDVGRYLADEPVSACPPSRVYRLRKLVRRNKTESIAIAAVAAAMLALVCTGVFSFIKIAAKNHRIEQGVQRTTEALRASELNEGAALDLQGRALMSSEWRKAGPPLEASYKLLVKNGGKLGEVLADRAAFYARSGMFHEAAEDYARAIDLNPQDINLWHHGMPLLLQAGDIDGFRRRRSSGLRRFATSRDAGTAGVAKTSLMIPAEGDDLRIAADLANAAMSNKPADESESVIAKAIAEYRSGEIEKSIPWFERAASIRNAYRVAQCDFFLAMVYCKTGRQEEAHQAMIHGVELVERKLPRVDGAGNASLINPEDWIICQFARREAEEMLGQVTLNPPPPPATAPEWASEKLFFEDEIRAKSEQIDRLASTPEADRLFQLRGQYYGHLGQFRNAIADYTESLKANPNNFPARVGLATTQLYLGQKQAYRASCAELLARFGDSTDPIAGSDVARVCFLLPGAVSDLSVPVNLANRGVGDGTHYPEWALYPDWMTMYKGMAEYRIGHYPLAVVWLKRARADLTQLINSRDRKYVAGKSWWESLVATTFFLAMAEQRLGDSQAAQKTLADARSLLKTFVPPANSGSVRVGSEHWMDAYIISREADAMFGIPATQPAAEASRSPRP